MTSDLTKLLDLVKSSAADPSSMMKLSTAQVFSLLHFPFDKDL